VHAALTRSVWQYECVAELIDGRDLSLLLFLIDKQVIRVKGCPIHLTV
jgi:hypothetical protein